MLSSKEVQTHKESSLLYKKEHGIVWNSGSLDYSELLNVHLGVSKEEHFEKVTEKCMILTCLVDIEPENLDDYGCPKVKNLVND